MRQRENKCHGDKHAETFKDDLQKQEKKATLKQTTTTSYLGGGFVPAHEPVLPGEGLQFGQLGAQTVLPLVALVGQ